MVTKAHACQQVWHILGCVAVGHRIEFTPRLAKSELWISDWSLPCGFLLLPLETGWEGMSF